MALKDNIRARRLELDMTLEEVAQIVGVTRQTVQKYESGVVTNIPSDKIELLAKALHTTPAYLMGWEKTLSGIAEPYNPSRRIPILGYISAGPPLFAEQHIEGYTYTDLNGGADYFGLRVRGDSMNALRIMDGDVLIVRVQPVVDNGDIAVVMVDDENATVKRFYRDDKTVTLMPQSTNPKHVPQIYDIRKTNIRVVGKVVQNMIRY